MKTPPAASETLPAVGEKIGFHDLRYQRFAMAFFRTFDLHTAYVEAGFKSSEKNRTSNICNLFTRSPLPQYMYRELERLRKKVDLDQQTHAIEVCRLAYSDLRDVAEWDPSGVRVKPSSTLSEAAARTISKVTSRTRTRIVQQDGESYPETTTEVEVSLHNKTAALDLLHRMYDKSQALRAELEQKLKAIAQIGARYVPEDQLPRYLAEVRLVLEGEEPTDHAVS